MGIVNRSMSRMDLRLLAAMLVLIGPPLGRSKVYLIQTKDDQPQDDPKPFDTKDLSNHQRRRQPQAARGRGMENFEFDSPEGENPAEMTRAVGNGLLPFEQNEEKVERVNDQPANYNKEVLDDEANVLEEDHSNAQNNEVGPADQNDEQVENDKDHDMKSESLYVYAYDYPTIFESSQTKNDFEDDADPTEKAFQMASDEERNQLKDAMEESVHLSEENLDYNSEAQDSTYEKVDSNIFVDTNDDDSSTEDYDTSESLSKEQVGRKSQRKYDPDLSNASANTENEPLEENENEVENVEEETSEEYSTPKGFLL